MYSTHNLNLALIPFVAPPPIQAWIEGGQATVKASAKFRPCGQGVDQLQVFWHSCDQALGLTTNSRLTWPCRPSISGSPAHHNTLWTPKTIAFESALSGDHQLFKSDNRWRSLRYLPFERPEFELSSPSSMGRTKKPYQKKSGNKNPL